MEPRLGYLASPFLKTGRAGHAAQLKVRRFNSQNSIPLSPPAPPPKDLGVYSSSDFRLRMVNLCLSPFAFGFLRFVLACYTLYLISVRGKVILQEEKQRGPDYPHFTHKETKFSESHRDSYKITQLINARSAGLWNPAVPYKLHMACSGVCHQGLC